MSSVWDWGVAASQYRDAGFIHRGSGPKQVIPKLFRHVHVEAVVNGCPRGRTNMKVCIVKQDLLVTGAAQHTFINHHGGNNKYLTFDHGLEQVVAYTLIEKAMH